MQELSLNILDIAQNSIKAGATLVRIEIEIDRAKNGMRIAVIDNGCGMDEATLERVVDPFYTTRTTRKVGLGLPLFREAAEATGGALHIRSQPGRGTTVRATFTLGHIDLAPLGDMTGTVVGLVQCNPKIDFVYRVVADGEEFCMDTREVRGILEGVPLSTPEVAVFLRGYLQENTENLLKRSTLI